jgi:hypothetical protein
LWPCFTPEDLRDSVLLWAKRLDLFEKFGFSRMPNMTYSFVNHLTEESPRSLSPRRIKEVGRLVVFYDLTLVHEQNTVGHRPRESHLMGNAKHGHAVLRK